MIRTAISPRFAIRILGVFGTARPPGFVLWRSDSAVVRVAASNTMLSEDALRRALERIGVDAPVRFDEVTPSTQDTARRLAREGSAEWTLVAAAHQTRGRGRLGRAWEDEPGRALLFSLVLRPDLPAARGGLLTLLAGWAMATACADLGHTVGCKWPNDLLEGERKIGGILGESDVQGDRFADVVLGVGVNVGAAPTDVAGAGALADVDEAPLLEAFLRHFAARYEPAHPAFTGAVLEGYRAVSLTIGTRVQAITTDGHLGVRGEAVDVDEAGALVVRTAEGLKAVGFGEVEHLRV
jgi:BirA family biotin operon repressor/biotin-[acetyl-CoA-carboxylase] ligase